MDSDTDSEIDSLTDSEMDSDTDSERDSLTDSEIDSDVDSEIDSLTDSEIDSDVDSEGIRLPILRWILIQTQKLIQIRILKETRHRF